ncbi:hypothetical protein [Candidatus Berkiella aquae]|uniref:Uncharacterized protein n=1 Tax=Candidatus Berkiella aquae TaxID=295108 RepID=A0A0Q9YJA6_9GAMM|nr:hypothetical protein [Candidatus Berkiella aquae]MCS5710678.1 hypothetical protein [Candidatus Berkiella aquae]
MKQGTHRLSLLKERARKIRKIDSTENASEATYSPVEHALTIPEIIANILYHYPHSGILGQNNIMTVSKLWHKVLKENDLIDDFSFKKLIEDCVKYPEGVIHILKDKSLQPYLTTEKLFKIISCHKAFAIHFLQNIDISNSEQKDVAILANYHSEVVMCILEKLKTYEGNATFTGLLMRLGKQDPIIAEHILNTPELIKRASLRLFSEINPNIAIRILNEPFGYGKCTKPGHYYPVVLFQYLEVLIEIGKKQKGFEFLKELNINTPEEFVCKLEDCALRLSRNVLSEIALYNEEVRMKIMMTPSLRKKVGKSSIIHLGEVHAKAAMYILETRILHSYNSFDSVLATFARHITVAKYIFNTPELFNLLSHEIIVSIASKSHEMAMHILKTEELCKLLESKDIIKLGYENPTVAKYILSTPEICAKMMTDDMFALANKHSFVVKNILDTDEFRKRIDDTQLISLECLKYKIRNFTPSAIQQQVCKQAQLWNVLTNELDEDNNHNDSVSLRRG